jgi:MurNAc alpha-1-phosphate uridylyltransferase
MTSPIKLGPTHAMLLAAGYGTRMRPLTQHTPKPLLPVLGRTLFDRALDRLEAAGVTQVAVNGHWLADTVRTACGQRAEPRLSFLHEPDLLDTGGGIFRALRAGALGHGLFFAINGDALWLDGPSPALSRLIENFDDATDALLLLHPAWADSNYDGRGDFFLDPNGLLARRESHQVAPFVFAGVQLLHPRLFEGAPDGPFSMNRLWDRAIAAGRARGLRHDGLWFHLSTPSDLDAAGAYLRQYR